MLVLGDSWDLVFSTFLVLLLSCMGLIPAPGRYLQWHHPDARMFEVCRNAGDNDCVIPGLYAMVRFITSYTMKWLTALIMLVGGRYCCSVGGDPVRHVIETSLLSY